MPLELQIPQKLKPFLTTQKRYKVAIGGRGGAKSMSIADMLTQKAQIEQALIGCLREYQNSLDDSVFALLKHEIKRLKVPGFKSLTNKIRHKDGGGFRFRGLARSIDAIKSMFGFKYFWLEEGQFISEGSLKILTPTLREEGSELWVSANPMSAADPFSQRFIVPYQKELDKNGFYEDDMHYIVKINHSDNPWFPAELEQERVHDFQALPRALYDHIWEGAFNDSVDNALIMAEWFDACIDAHIKLGFEAIGSIVATHDPSDTGVDDKGFALRHGSVVTMVEEKSTGDINEGCDWATGLAIQNDADIFLWDCDGLGIGLNRQINKSFEGKHTIIAQYKGSEKVDNPDAPYEPADKVQIHNQKTNKEAIKNCRAQYYFELRNRIYRTFIAVTKGVYTDPDTMISFSSDMSELMKLRSELCRLPIKPNPNGMFELYTKEEMLRKFKIPSPNLADSVKMLFKFVYKPNFGTTKRPIPIRPMGEAMRANRKLVEVRHHVS
jgi:phage terminase large subunit